MHKYLPVVFGAAAIVACGGDDGGEDTGFAFLQAVPSEAVLCSFVVDVTTEDQVLDALGEPTSYSGDAFGSFLQYWVGSIAETGASGVRGVYFAFDAQGKLDTPSVTQIPFPQCWRDQIDAREAARNRF